MAGVDFMIGADPRSVGRTAPQSTPTWGTALAKLGQSWVMAHHRKKQAEAKAAKRAGWATQLGEGATVRQIAMRDPSIIGDTAFLGFLDKTKKAKGFEDILDDQGHPVGQRGPQGRVFSHPLAPAPEEPEPERWETVQDPYGRGGAAQRSSVSGKFTNYQGPAAPVASPQRRIIKGPDNLNYYEDTKERVLPNVAAPTPEPTTPDQAKFEHVRALAGDWENATKPVRDLSRQRDLMQIGLEAARKGDMAAGSQAVLVTFQKILDPTSVVRESEYARSSSGLSMFERVKGAAEKLGKGGAGVSVSELQAFARLADEAVSKFGGGWLNQERSRIGRFADAYNIPRDYVFQGGRFAPQGVPQVMSRSAPQGAPPRSITPLARALAGGRPAPSPAAPVEAALGAPPAPQGQAPSEMSAGDRHRIEMYARLPKDALQRQAEDMRDNPTAYSDAEKHAAGMAWERVFGGR